MKKIIRIVWTIFCVLLSISYLISSASAFIKPSSFSYISIFTIAFPYLLLLMILFCTVNLFINKKTAFALLIMIFFGYRNIVNTIAFNNTKWEEKKDSATLRIMTWNVEGFINLFPQNNPLSAKRVQMLKTIQQLQPDILCLQEYYDVEKGRYAVSSRHELDSIGYHFYYFSKDRVESIKNESVHMHGVAIFSIKSFLDSGIVNIIKKGVENVAYINIELNHKPIRIFTGHLLSFALYNDTTNATDEAKNIYRLTYDHKRSIQAKLRGTEKIHEKEVKIIRDAIIESPSPVIYCGDMNTTPTSYNYRFLKDDLQDAFLAKGFGTGTTFYKLGPTLRIDICFADNRLKILQCKVEEKKLSDHYPVITDVQWNK